MPFNNYSLQFWLIILIFICLYILWARKPVSRFLKEVYEPAHKDDKYNENEFDSIPKALRLLLWYIIAPVLHFRLNNYDLERAQDRERQANEERAKFQRKQESDNNIRTEKREQWFSSNKIQFYFRKESGIYAVLTPEEYSQCQNYTQRARRNEIWTNNEVLMPSEKTMLFVTEPGRKIIVENAKVENPIEGNMCAWLTDLDDLEKEYKAELIEKNDIFVPYVNESLIPFKDHKSFKSLPNKNYIQSASVILIEEQLPSEMRPIRVNE